MQFRKLNPQKWAPQILALSSLICVTIFQVFAEAKASGEVYTVFRYEAAAYGRCLPRTSGSADAILARNGIRTRGRSTEAEQVALAKGIGQVENLLGSPLPRKWQTTYNYITSPSNTRWNQAVSAIHVRRPPGTNQGENIARLVHELGHKVGNSGEYPRYRQAIRGQECRISGYSAKRNNEQFAEAFAAYITYPDLLAQKCPKAYAFFSQKLFPNSEGRVASCGSSRSSRNFKASSDEPRPTVKRRSFFDLFRKRDKPNDNNEEEDEIVETSPGYHYHRKKSGEGSR